MILWLVLTGCLTDDDPCAYVHDLVRSDGSLALTPEEHGVGWGNETCLQCHQVWNTHRHDCARSVDLDMEAIREAADFEDTTTCVPCHGTNGVPGLAEAGTTP